MSTVYRMSDRFEVKIANTIFSLGPLDYKTKSDIQSSVIAGRPMDAAVIALKNSIKDVKGLKISDGSNYELEFSDSGELTDECINDLLNISEADKLSLVAISLTNGVPEGEFLDEKGKPMDGVSFVKKKASTRKK